MKKIESKIKSQFKNLKVERPTEPKYILHSYADYVEINALFAKEEITVADISDLLIDVEDPNIMETDLDEISTDEIASLNSEKNDIIEDRILEIFNLCFIRSKIYQPDEYPFQIKDNLLHLKDEITDKQKIYIFLLLSSNLNYFDELEAVLTKDFELLSWMSLRNFLPPKAIVKSFGKNSEFKGNTVKKIKELATQLGLENNFEKVKYLSPHNVQERGLDLIGWLPYKDKNPNMVIFLCQCACGKSWDSKQNDTTFFAGYFRFEISPIHTMFVPYSLSNEGRNFDQYDRILNNLFFDRKRILEQIGDTDFFKGYLSFQIVEKCLEKQIVLN